MGVVTRYYKEGPAFAQYWTSRDLELWLKVRHYARGGIGKEDMMLALGDWARGFEQDCANNSDLPFTLHRGEGWVEFPKDFEP